MKEKIIQLQKLLTSIPAINPESGGDGEWAKARALENYLTDNGFPPAIHYDTPDERVPEKTRPNFVIRIEGAKQRPCIWVMTHLDVVPPGERMDDGSWKGWDTDPFGLHVEGDMLYGRGVEDNQHSMVAKIMAAMRLMESGCKPPNDIALLFVSAEETGSEYGLKYLLGRHPGIFGKEDFILVPDGGNEEGSLIEVAEKSVLWLNFAIYGKQTHGSTPQLGINTFRAMSDMVMTLDRRLSSEFDAKDDIYRPAASTFEPTRHERNVANVNTIPGEEHFSFDCRILPCYDIDVIISAVREVVSGIDAKYRTETVIEIENRLDAPAPTSKDAPPVRVLQKALKSLRGIDAEPRGLGGSTVAAFFRKAGYPAVVWSTVEGVAHQVNEHTDINDIIADAAVYEYIFLNGAR